jgi:hypothetical protein
MCALSTYSHKVQEMELELELELEIQVEVLQVGPSYDTHSWLMLYNRQAGVG